MVLIPGTSLAVVANANVTLDQKNGSLVAVDLLTQKTLPETRVESRSIAGFMTADSVSSRIYVPDRGNDALLVYDYAVPGINGTAISLTPVAVPTPAETYVANGIETDKAPMAVRLAAGTTPGNLLLVTNNTSGSVSIIDPLSLLPIDFDSDDGELKGLPLISSVNFRNKNQKPGRGANRLVPSLDSRLLFVTSTLTNNIYVLDTRDQKVEAMMDLSGIVRSAGTRAMVIAADDLAYIVHRGAQAVIVLDVSGIQDNGIDMELVDAKLVDIIPTGRDPEGIALSSTGNTLFVSNQTDNSVLMIDRATRKPIREIFLSEVSPGDLVPDPDRKVIYVLNFISNSISILDDTTGDLLGTIAGQ